MYCKGGVLYPVALINEQNKMLQMSSMLFQALKVVFDKPQGQARGYTNTFYQLICGGVSYAGTTP
ncbi:hypothetical protein ACQGSH_26540 [Bacillus wiedmannii]|uniref:hypothetical protein n=1 Tax=Bacillus wiedmannii TaxID=1890302 RepID=UPI001F092F3B|nr:hypothetical protein [Bacillus wiedmannii]MCX3317178.1 hypothetical protein [Bacillus wiedmannii]